MAGALISPRDLYRAKTSRSDESLSALVSSDPPLRLPRYTGFPRCAFGGVGCDRVPPGRRLFQGISARDIYRSIKDVFKKIETPFAEAYTSHGFRLGASQELKERGSQRATVSGAGGRRTLASRWYVDGTADISRALDRLRIEDCEPDSIDGDADYVRFFGGENPHGRCMRRAVGIGIFGFRSLQFIAAI